MNLPSGIVTFLAADIEGSEELRARSVQTFHNAARRCDAIAAEILPLHSCAPARTLGKGGLLLAVVSNPANAFAAARALLQTCQADASFGEAAIRFCLHTGPASHYQGDYHGDAVSHCRHLLSMGYGWQVLVSSDASAALQDTLPLGMRLLDLGEHPLCDLSAPEHLYQILYPGFPADFPPLRSLANYPNNLPLHADRFIGR